MKNCFEPLAYSLCVYCWHKKVITLCQWATNSNHTLRALSLAYTQAIEKKLSEKKKNKELYARCKHIFFVRADVPSESTTTKPSSVCVWIWPETSNKRTQTKSDDNKQQIHRRNMCSSTQMQPAESEKNALFLSSSFYPSRRRCCRLLQLPAVLCFGFLSLSLFIFISKSTFFYSA